MALDAQGGRAARQPIVAVSWPVREAAFLVAALLSYSLIRGLTDDRTAAAFRNAEGVLAWERQLGLLIEADLQHAVVASDVAADLANAIYMAYWPAVFGTLTWLLVRHRSAYPFYRNTLLISGSLSLVLFACFPLAPPRMLPDHGFVDTIAARSSAYRGFDGSVLVNEYAAMPSLHFGWVLVCAIAVARLSRSRAVRLAAWCAPPVMFAAIVLTANHYVVDGIAGGAVVTIGLGVARLLRDRRGQRPGRAVPTCKECSFYAGGHA